MLPIADIELRRGDLDPDREVDRDLPRHLRDRPGADRGRAQAARPLPAPLRPEPGRAVRAACSRWPTSLKLVGKEAFRPRRGGAAAVGARAGAGRLLGGHDDRDPAVRRRPGRGRPLRDRRLDRHPLLLRLRLVRLLRPAARRLGVGLEVQLPRRDALGGAADLLRDLDGPGAARRGDDGRLAVAGLDRRGAGRDLVHRPAVRRLPDLHGRRLRRDQPGAVRPARGRRRARRGLPDRVRRHALRLVHARRVPRDVRDLGDRRHLLPRRLAWARARAGSTRSGCW